jgi:O-antigen ligase/polysaccharide polymerase Wzy-like membrane protein
VRSTNVGRVRRAITVLAVVAVLAGPTALAFFQGGFFDLPRLIAALVAWLLVGVAALVSPQPLPRGRGGRLAIGGLVLLTVWTGVSIAWTPLSAPGTDALQRQLLYLADLIAAAALLRDPLARRAAEPALALGTLVVIGYGLLERLLPGVFTLARSNYAFGRLEQPLTYWNATGALAAIGAVMCVRLAGDDTRARWMRTAAAAASVPLAVGLWLSFSRGALAALLVGLLALVALAPTRAQLRAFAVAALAGVPAAVAANALRGVRALEGTTAARERDGLVMLAVLVALCAAAAAAVWLMARAEERGRISPAPLSLSRRASVAAGVALVAVAAVAVAVSARDSGHSAVSGASAQRLSSIESDRYVYWKVALRNGFESQPVRGVGAGGFAVVWLQHRPKRERAYQPHSLYVQTLAELGIVGFAFLAVCLAGLAIAATRAWRIAPARAAGPIAALVVFFAHSAIDWDWDMPAITLVAMVLAGLLIAASEEEGLVTA